MTTGSYRKSKAAANVAMKVYLHLMDQRLLHALVPECTVTLNWLSRVRGKEQTSLLCRVSRSSEKDGRAGCLQEFPAVEITTMLAASC